MHPELYWDDGRTASIDDPKVKYAVQATDRAATAFTRKADALRYIADWSRMLKDSGWTVSGKSDAKICYRGEESLSILLTSRGKPRAI